MRGTKLNSTKYKIVHLLVLPLKRFYKTEQFETIFRNALSLTMNSKLIFDKMHLLHSMFVVLEF